jgi:hypothetical protein
MPRLPLLPLCLLATLVPLRAQEVTIPWTPGFAGALARAKEQRKVLFVAVHVPGERANEAMRELYLDFRFARLGAETVNVFASPAAKPRVPGVTVEQQQADEKVVRERVLGRLPEEPLPAPHHAFLGPDGGVLSSAMGELTAGELEWMWADAIRRVRPDFAWDLSPAARAPRRFTLGRVARVTAEPIPDADTVARAVDEVQQQRKGWAEALQHLPALLRSSDPVALRWVENELRRLPDSHLAGPLAKIGQLSPRSWWSIVAQYVDHRDDGVRLAAAVALEQLGEPKALPALVKQYRAETNEPVAGHLLRAMARCAPTDATVLQLVMRAIERDRAVRIRVHAAIAAAQLEERSTITRSLTRSLGDESAQVRAAAAYAIATRRDQALRQPLEQALAAEKDDFARQYLEPALAALRGADLGEALEQFLEKVAGDV